jgi:hypothetical protein
MFKRAYERGFRDGARLATEVVEAVLAEMREKEGNPPGELSIEELRKISPGGTDSGEDDE